jgi:hypothetical protein
MEKAFQYVKLQNWSLFNLSNCYLDGFVIWMVGSHFDNLTLDLSNAHKYCYKSLCLRMRSHFIILFFKTFLVVYETSQFEQCLIPKLGPNFDSKIQNYELPKNENPFENVEASSFAFFHTCEVSLNLNQGCLGLFYWNENVESTC